MVSVQLKTIDEGVSPDIDELTKYMSSQLIEDSISIAEEADLTLKVKFTIDNDQEKVLIQLRETESKSKLGEKVIHYFPQSYLKDVTSECHALVASLIHEEA